LLGYDQSIESAPAGADVELVLYWRPLHPIGVVYDVAVHLVDEDGVTWNASDTARPADWRFAPGTDSWPMDGYVMDPLILRLLDGAPPGEYTFRVALVRRDTRQTVAVHQIGRLLITRPARGDQALEEGMSPAAASSVWGGLRLLGSRTDRAEAAPGSPMRVTLLWQAADPSNIPNNGRVTLRLTTADGAVVLSREYPIARDYPPDRWQAGDRLRTEILLRLPASTPDGDLSWQVQLGPNGPAQPIAALHVRAPERQWTAPPLDIQTHARLGQLTTLLGAQIALPEPDLQPPTTITVTLVWRAEAETTTSYHVFLHLLDQEGRIAAQSDGEPAHWTRPTTGWLPGEIIIDAHQLTIPAAGDYTLSAGLYVVDGERLTTDDGADAAILTIFSVKAR
jgi:hypothetical protein